MLTRRVLPAGLLLGMALIIASCAAPFAGPGGLAAAGSDAHIPSYARVPYQPFSREAAIQIAYREWRAFGQPVVLAHTELPFDNERAEGLWQRVGDYWWLGLPLGDRDQGFTGTHDQNGRIFSAATRCIDSREAGLSMKSSSSTTALDGSLQTSSYRMRR